MNDCVAPEILQAYALSQLDEGVVQLVEQHLENCETCCIKLSKIVDQGDSTLVGDQPGSADQLSLQAVGSSSSQGAAYRYWVGPRSRQVDEPVPRMIGRYRIERMLGAGGFGRVYLATDEKLDRRIAIKVSHAPTATSGRQLALIQAESKTVASLDHPNIVPIYDVGSSDEFPIYLVTKFIDGQNLADELRKGITQAQAVGWTIQIAEALAYAHQKGVIHRDVKPQNILIDTCGHARLTDFGLAWRSTDDRVEYPNAGTPAYMSPEQRTPGKLVDHRTDIFSLGLVLKELLNEADTMGKSSTGDLTAICQRAIAANPEDRFESAHEFATSLRRYAASRGWSSIPDTLDHLKSPLWPRTSVWGLATNGRSWGATALLIGVALLGINYWRTSLARQQEIDKINSYLLSVPSELSHRLKHFKSIGLAGLSRLRTALKSDDSNIRVRAQLALLKQSPELANDVADTMLDAHFELASVIWTELLPHKHAVKQRLISDLLDPSKTTQHRLNASSFLALAFPQDKIWEDQAVGDAIAHCLVVHDSIDIHAYIRAHRASSSCIIKHLRNLVMSIEDRSDRRLSKPLEIWEHLVQEDVDQLVSLLVESPIELADRLLTKCQDKHYAVSRLQALMRVRQLDPQQPTAALLYRAQFMAAYALLRLGFPEEFWRLWLHSPTPDQTTVATFVAADSPVTLSLLADQLLDSDMLQPVTELPERLSDRLFAPTLSVRRQLVHALFRSPRWQALEPARQNEIFERFGKLIMAEADPGMHAHINWILKGRIPPNQRLRQAWFPKNEQMLDDKRPWSLNSLGMVMIRIDNSEQVDHSFALSQCEVESRHFQQFVSETGFIDSAPHEPSEAAAVADVLSELPQNNISWYACAAFCNWLSQKEGLDECYLPNAEGKFAAGMRIKPEAARLNGYRLPSSVEWELCCRAGAKTRFSSGELERYMVGYGWTLMTTRDTAPVGVLPPNALGFCDMHGNVAEWMLDNPQLEEQPEFIVDTTLRLIRGGDYLAGPPGAGCDHSATVPASHRGANIGFRIARTK